jgi:hypothetical protein
MYHSLTIYKNSKLIGACEPESCLQIAMAHGLGSLTGHTDPKDAKPGVFTCKLDVRDFKYVRADLCPDLVEFWFKQGQLLFPDLPTYDKTKSICNFYGQGLWINTGVPLWFEYMKICWRRFPGLVCGDLGEALFLFKSMVDLGIPSLHAYYITLCRQISRDSIAEKYCPAPSLSWDEDYKPVDSRVKYQKAYLDTLTQLYDVIRNNKEFSDLTSYVKKNPNHNYSYLDCIREAGIYRNCFDFNLRRIVSNLTNPPILHRRKFSTICEIFPQLNVSKKQVAAEE